MDETVVVLAPHCDDETLGVGGTIRKHLDAGDEVKVIVATGGDGKDHPVFSSAYLEGIQREAQRAMRVLGVEDLRILGMSPVTYPERPRYEVNEVIHKALRDTNPSVLYVPFPYDMHYDHRALFHAASVAWRPNTPLGRSIKKVLAYEVVSETHWQSTAFEPAFSPTVWSALTEKQLRCKLEALESYQSQMMKFPATRSIEAVAHLARWRGSQVGESAAEGLVLVREIC